MLKRTGLLTLLVLCSSLLWSQSASEEIFDIAQKLEDYQLSLNNQIEQLENSLSELTSEKLKDEIFIESLNDDLLTLKMSLEKSQEDFQSLRRDYEKLEKRSGSWRTLSLILGGTTVVSFSLVMLLVFIR